MKCGIKSPWCNGEDIKLCRMKSASQPFNKYEGREIPICRECRKAQNGQFKIVNI